MLHTKLY